MTDDDCICTISQLLAAKTPVDRIIKQFAMRSTREHAVRLVRKAEKRYREAGIKRARDLMARDRALSLRDAAQEAGIPEKSLSQSIAKEKTVGFPLGSQRLGNFKSWLRETRESLRGRLDKLRKIAEEGLISSEQLGQICEEAALELDSMASLVRQKKMRFFAGTMVSREEITTTQ